MQTQHFAFGLVVIAALFFGCPPGPQTEPGRGNGIVDAPDESCDDGNTVDDGNCCDAACARNNERGFSGTPWSSEPLVEQGAAIDREVTSGWCHEHEPRKVSDSTFAISRERGSEQAGKRGKGRPSGLVEKARWCLDRVGRLAHLLHACLGEPELDSGPGGE